MKIQKIHIQNFRSLVDLTFDLSNAGNNWVIYGANGTGKTSVLEACQSALGMKVQRLLPQDQDYTIELEVLHDSTYHIFKTPHQHEIEGGQLTLSLEGVPKRLQFSANSLQDIKRKQFIALSFSSWRAPILKDKLDLSVGRGRTLDKNDDNALLRLQQYYVNLLGLKALNPAKVDEKISQLNEAWNVFYPKFDDIFSVEPIDRPLDEVTDIDAINGFNLFLKHQGMRIPVNELSSGEIEILSMLGTLIIEKQKPDIVFIDEPELHLNQVWHRCILKALNRFSPTTQYIVATHSMDLWDSVYSTEHAVLGN